MPIMLNEPMPKNCVECPCASDYISECMAMPISFDREIEPDGRPDWCPLHEVKFTEDEK